MKESFGNGALVVAAGVDPAVAHRRCPGGLQVNECGFPSEPCRIAEQDRGTLAVGFYPDAGTGGSCSDHAETGRPVILDGSVVGPVGHKFQLVLRSAAQHVAQVVNRWFIPVVLSAPSPQTVAPSGRCPSGRIWSVGAMPLRCLASGVRFVTVQEAVFPKADL